MANGTQVDYDALAKKFGGTSAWTPVNESAPDYDALAKQYGGWTAVDEPGMQRNPDGSFVITPAPGESFLETMKRAAAAGKTVTPQMIQSQARKGLKDAPVVLGAAPVIGATGAASLAGAGEAGELLQYHALKAIPQAYAALKAAAAAHPIAAEIIKQGLKGTALGAGLRLGGKLIKLSDLLGTESK